MRGRFLLTNGIGLLCVVIDTDTWRRMNLFLEKSHDKKKSVLAYYCTYCLYIYGISADAGGIYRIYVHYRYYICSRVSLVQHNLFASFSRIDYRRYGIQIG
jgi:hypothetical protein